MTTKTNGKRFATALMALGLSGCAQVIGMEDFTLAEASSGGSSSGSSGIPMDPCNKVHGCDRATAIDFTGLSVAHVSFNASGYDPPCIRVDLNGTVQFDGAGYTFEDVPLAGGVFPMEDMNSPIKNPTPANVMSASFVLGTECSYPYFSPLIQKTGVVFTK